MNILIINGSPKGTRSNSLQLANAFAEGIQAASATPPAIETIHVSQKNIQPCKGCFSCWKTTPGKCVIADDMSEILDRILRADLTIWAFPLYYFGLPGPLKTLIDRQLPLNLPFMTKGAKGGSHPSRYDLSHKKTVLISTCGFYTAQSNYDSILAQFDRICGKGNYTTLFCGQGELFSIPELSKRTSQYLYSVQQAGQEYIRKGISDATRQKLEELLFPRAVYEQMADASWGVSETGQKEDSSLVFTKQMAALYDPSSYPGHDIVLDMHYTDLNKRYQIILGEKGSEVSQQGARTPQTIIHTPYDVWQSIAAGEIEGSQALMEHRYSVEGDFDLLLNWDHYFGTRDQETIPDPGQKKTNMIVMLAPWIVLWITSGMAPVPASLLTLATTSLLPLVFYRTRKTIYDIVSASVVSLLCIAMAAGVAPLCVIPLSYFAFGAMWSVSALLKIPLSAWYSMNDYGGEAAFDNPIFLKTNRILSLAWGILYVLTPIWTYFMMQTKAGSYTGLINSILPAFLGLFTAWFQKWYPAKVAKGH